MGKGPEYTLGSSRLGSKAPLMVGLLSMALVHIPYRATRFSLNAHRLLAEVPSLAQIETNPSITGIRAVFSRRLAVEWGGTVIAKSCCKAVASRGVTTAEGF